MRSSARRRAQPTSPSQRVDDHGDRLRHPGRRQRPAAELGDVERVERLAGIRRDVRAPDAERRPAARVMPMSWSSPGRSVARTSMTVAVVGGVRDDHGPGLARRAGGGPRRVDAVAARRRASWPAARGRRRASRRRPRTRRRSSGAARRPVTRPATRSAATPSTVRRIGRRARRGRARRAAPRCRRTGPSRSRSKTSTRWAPPSGA